MYNDYTGSHTMYVGPSMYQRSLLHSDFTLVFSGETLCLHCGEDWTSRYSQFNTEYLLCPECTGEYICSSCGECICENDLVYFEDSDEIIDVDRLSSTKVGSTKLNDVPLICYDSDGNKLDVEIVPSTVSATVAITSPSKEVPIKLLASGELDGVAIKSLVSSVNTVTVYGTKDAISSIEYLPVNVDVSGVKEDKNYTINLTKPTGIREISIKTINVELKVDNIVSKDVEAIHITPVNVANGYIAQAIGEKNSTVTVIVKGSKSVIDTLVKAGVESFKNIIFHLKNYTGTDSEYNYTLTVKTSSWVAFIEHELSDDDVSELFTIHPELESEFNRDLDSWEEIVTLYLKWNLVAAN